MKNKWLKEATDTSNDDVLQALVDWVKNNSDKKMSSWDFICDLLRSKGVL